MVDKRKVPEIRFKGYDKEWVEQALGEITTPFSEPVPTPNDGYWRLGIRSHTKGTFHDFIRPGRELETAKMHKVRANNFIVNITFAWEHAVAITGSSDDGKLVSHRFPQFSFNDGMVPEYFKFLILDKRFKHHLWLSSPGGAGRNRVLKISKMLEYPFWVPNETEQSKIADFFQHLDSSIILHQCKYDKLVTLKKSMLKKIFPQNGATTPEIRFTGFSGPWGEKKLNGIANKVTEKNASKEYAETFTNSAEFGIISQRDYFDKDISNSENIGGYYVVRPGDFVYNPRISTFAPVGPVNLNKLGRTGIMSPLYTVFRTKDIDKTFLDYFFKTECWHPFMFYNGDTGARADRFSIKDSIFLDLPIPYPSVQEQQKIGSYFRQLDELITLQRTQVEKLKQIKTACLNKMFI